METMIAEIIIDKDELEKIILAKLAKTNVKVLAVEESVNWVDQYFNGLVVRVEIPEGE